MKIRLLIFMTQKEFDEFAERMNRWQKEGFLSGYCNLRRFPNLLMRKGKLLGWFFSQCTGRGEREYLGQQMGRDIYSHQGSGSTTDVYQTVLWSIPVTCENPEKVMDFFDIAVYG